MVDHLPLVVWLPTAALAWTTFAVITWHEHVARRRATRHQP